MSTSRAGCILWLPPVEEIAEERRPSVPAKCFNHPVIVLSSAGGVNVVLILTSLSSTPLTPQTHPSPTTRSHLLPIYPSPPHPDSSKLLHLAHNRTLHKNSYIRIDNRHHVDCKALRAYSRHIPQDTLRLTESSWGVLLADIGMTFVPMVIVSSQTRAERRAARRERRVRGGAATGTRTRQSGPREILPVPRAPTAALSPRAVAQVQRPTPAERQSTEEARRVVNDYVEQAYRAPGDWEDGITVAGITAANSPHLLRPSHLNAGNPPDVLRSSQIPSTGRGPAQTYASIVRGERTAPRRVQTQAQPRSHTRTGASTNAAGSARPAPSSSSPVAARMPSAGPGMPGRVYIYEELQALDNRLYTHTHTSAVGVAERERERHPLVQRTGVYGGFEAQYGAVERSANGGVGFDGNGDGGWCAVLAGVLKGAIVVGTTIAACWYFGRILHVEDA